MNINQFLDTKHGKFIGRVYLLVVLFLGNLLVPVGAVSYFINGGTPVVMGIGIAITVISIAILSTPYDLSKFTPEK